MTTISHEAEQYLAEAAKSLYVGRHREAYNPPLDKAKSHGTPYVGKHRTRTHTPDEALPSGAKRLQVKRVCDGCGEAIGDVSEAELDLAMCGATLPSVIDEHGCAR